MQCVSDLVKLRDAVISRVRVLRQIASPIASPLKSEDRRVIAYVTIEIDNLIIGGLRQYTKSSLLRGRAASGARVTATVQPNSPEQAAAYIFRSLNPKGYAKRRCPNTISERDEIVFRDPKQTERVLIDYQTSNVNTFALALSLNAEVFAEAKICRHFFAHRAQNTCDAVRVFANNLGIAGRVVPEHVVMHGRPGTGVRLLDGWFSDVENFFDLAT